MGYPAPRRRPRFCLLFMLGWASAVSLCAMARRPHGAVPFPVDAAHPYAGAFLVFNQLTPEERDAVASSQADEALTPAAREARSEIEAALVEGRGAPPQWQVEHDPLLPGYDPDFLKSLDSFADARFARAERAKDDPAAGDAAALDVLALLQSVGPGLPSEEWSRQQGSVVAALKRLGERGPARAPAEAAALAAALRALPPPTAFAEMVRADPSWRMLGDKLRRALEREARALGLSPDLIGPKTLRMTGVVIEPGRSAIALETSGDAFWLEPGKTHDDVTLLEIDAHGRRARIRFQGRDAVIELKSRRIERWNDEVLERAARSLSAKSDFWVAGLLGARRGSLSGHFERLDAFGSEMTTLWETAVSDPARLSDPAVRAGHGKRLMAAVPGLLSEDDFEDCVRGILEYRERGRTASAERERILELLDRQAAAR